LKNSNGDFVGYHEVEQLAGLNNIYVRTGCFCNPGACYRYLNLSKEEVLANLGNVTIN
jgi:molybdenum cofactor sulfurtransferase